MEVTGTLGSYRSGDDERRSSWGAAAFTSASVYVALGFVVFFVGTATHEAIKERSVDLTFTEKIVKPEPPPPPPPPQPVEVKPAPPPPVAAPVVPKNMKIRKLDAPPPPKELLAPKDMPLEKPKEADPSQDKGVAVYGDPSEAGDPAGLEGGVAGARASGSATAIALPEDADPPTPLKSNEPPAYPQEARATGKMGTVILKVIIRADGTVADVQVMRGDEPFASAALASVKKWKYEPARYKGQAITVYRIIQIPFKLNV